MSDKVMSDRVASFIWSTSWCGAFFVMLATDSISMGTKYLLGSLMVANLIGATQLLNNMEQKETDERLKEEAKQAMSGFNKK